MKKRFLYVLALCVSIITSYGQNSLEEMKWLKELLQNANNDSARVQITYELAYGYRFSNIDSSLYYSDITIGLADKMNLPSIKAQMLSLKGATVLEAGKLPESLRFQFIRIPHSKHHFGTGVFIPVCRFQCCIIYNLLVV